MPSEVEATTLITTDRSAPLRTDAPGGCRRDRPLDPGRVKVKPNSLLAAKAATEYVYVGRTCAASRSSARASSACCCCSGSCSSCWGCPESTDRVVPTPRFTMVVLLVADLARSVDFYSRLGVVFPDDIE